MFTPHRCAELPYMGAVSLYRYRTARNRSACADTAILTVEKSEQEGKRTGNKEINIVKIFFLFYGKLLVI